MHDLRGKTVLVTGASRGIGASIAFLLSGTCASATGATFDVNGASYVRR